MTGMAGTTIVTGDDQGAPEIGQGQLIYVSVRALWNQLGKFDGHESTFREFLVNCSLKIEYAGESGGIVVRHIAVIIGLY